MDSISDIHSDDKRLLARVDDALRMCISKGACFIGFLDARQTAVVRRYLSAVNTSALWELYGGHEDAERTMLGVFADEEVRAYRGYPIEAVAFRFRRDVKLTHRDVLGSLMGCQIAREKIGDILCENGLAVVFTTEELAPFLSQTISKIGREGVKADYPFEGNLPVFREYEPITGTVASPRVDAILKLLLSCSREQAATHITSMLVSIDHQPCRSVSVTLKEGQVISVKGRGRFVIDDLSGTSAKGRVIVKARRFT